MCNMRDVRKQNFLKVCGLFSFPFGAEFAVYFERNYEALVKNIRYVFLVVEKSCYFIRLKNRGGIYDQALCTICICSTVLYL